jgi:tRNA A37 threonylcarbamoyladenosine synthetase subunit TsaC/SUA5/YrdC
MNGSQDLAERGYEVLRQGGVVLLPTDVGFGLVGCSDEAVARIYELKGRPHSKACVTVATMAILEDVADVPDASMREWLASISRHTPIAVVSRYRGDSVLLRSLSPFVKTQATSGPTIASFLNAGELVTSIGRLAQRDGRLVIGSSANVAFTGNNYALEDVPASIRDHVDLVIEGERARWHNADRLATTILDLQSGELIRRGINHAMIEGSWRTFRGERLRAG